MPSPDIDLRNVAQHVAQHPATAGIAGALLLSLRMAPGVSWIERVSTFTSGALVAVYLAPAACEYLRIQGDASVRLLSFSAGLFGLSLMYQVMEAVKRAPWGDFIASWLQRKGGDKS
jgi:hypothetical protein